MELAGSQIETKIPRDGDILIYNEEKHQWFLSPLHSVDMENTDNIQGMDGINGMDGMDGEQGEKGDQGEKGEQGERGEQGEKGDPGTSESKLDCLICVNKEKVTLKKYDVIDFAEMYSNTEEIEFADDAFNLSAPGVYHLRLNASKGDFMFVDIDSKEPLSVKSENPSCYVVVEYEKRRVSCIVHSSSIIVDAQSNLSIVKII